MRATNTTMSDDQQQLDTWLKSAPEWVRHAYNNDAAVNRTMNHCASAGDSTEAMLWRLAGALYEQKNCWAQTAMDQARSSPIPPLVVQRAKPNP